MIREEFEVVVLAEDLPVEGLTKGMLGDIVLVHEKPHLAYMVEFVDDAGRTIAMPSLLPSQVADYIQPK
ncbi:TPA: DUF4926 domain-containing protein [Enterobacter kobei]|jgi:hypothetical protein|uniref:DUF4926 domain-containing protein n=1 Tax=Enterobacter TaxID=547 RepID=UPI0013A72EBF|nr:MULTISPECIES: DUF4926 domain-containing protein [Enterobacter]MBE8916456.1 DUF4926 domain-containing protein [Enterobacter kobei]MCE1981409.1 DUF4926 domain-containing protein [Enterobacter kobei]QIB84034.1 DUF4926 domain-containing protein [Enterobacter sp. T2]UZQ67444.1 DUF4926 domain-containing protein [Enterobacter kobei]BBV73032.1 hypothetical protein STW0522ENT51_40340 [Enterobacter kobei]